MVNPAPNWQYPQMPPPPVLPVSMRRAIWLMWAGAGLSVVFSVANGVMTNDLFTMRTTNTPTNHSAFVGGQAFGAIVQVALWLWMLWKVRAGRPWARVLSTIFFGFMCLQFLVVVATGPGVTKVLITAYFLTALSALVMLYQRESSEFFSAAKLASSVGPGYMQAGYGQPVYGQPPQQYGQPPQQYGQPPQPYGEAPPYGGQQPPSSDLKHQHGGGDGVSAPAAAAR